VIEHRNHDHATPNRRVVFSAQLYLIVFWIKSRYSSFLIQQN